MANSSASTAPSSAPCTRQCLLNRVHLSLLFSNEPRTLTTIRRRPMVFRRLTFLRAASSGTVRTSWRNPTMSRRTKGFSNGLCRSLHWTTTVSVRPIFDGAGINCEPPFRARKRCWNILLREIGFCANGERPTSTNPILMAPIVSPR